MPDQKINQPQNRQAEDLHKDIFPYDIAVEEWSSGPELIAPNSNQLAYTGLLIPRFPSHHIKGDLKNILPSWIKQICISFNWKLEFAEPALEYLQLGITSRTEIRPAEMIHITRTELSKMIFSEFPRFSRDNLGNDFWAESYMMVAGAHPSPPNMIENFIRTVRRQQGIS